MQLNAKRAGEGSYSFVAFIVGAVRYALDIAHVREIVTPLVADPSCPTRPAAWPAWPTTARRWSPSSTCARASIAPRPRAKPQGEMDPGLGRRQDGGSRGRRRARRAPCFGGGVSARPRARGRRTGARHLQRDDVRRAARLRARPEQVREIGGVVRPSESSAEERQRARRTREGFARHRSNSWPPPIPRCAGEPRHRSPSSRRPRRRICSCAPSGIPTGACEKRRAAWRPRSAPPTLCSTIGDGAFPRRQRRAAQRRGGNPGCRSVAVPSRPSPA